MLFDQSKTCQDTLYDAVENNKKQAPITITFRAKLSKAFLINKKSVLSGYVPSS